MAFLAPSHHSARANGVTVALLLAGALCAVITLSGQQTNFTIYTPESRRTLAVRPGSPETFALEQLAATFGLTFTEDRAAGGLVITTRKGTIVAIPGQSFLQVSGRGVVGLDAPIRRERNSWIAPLDFLVKALGPALGEPVVIRRSSRLILVGNVHVPQVSGRVEKMPSGARVVVSIQPFTPHRVTRDGNRMTVRIDATALDVTPLTGFISEFAQSAKVDGPAIVIELGPSVASFRTSDDRAQQTLTIELLPPPPPPPPPPPAQPTPTPTPTAALTPAPAQTPAAGRPQAPTPGQPPQIDLAAGMRTIVIDPGHGGDDEGVKGAKGTVEKELTLLLARRLRAAIEARLGLRVLLTREGDEPTPMDRRTAVANNNKADLFISLHANGSVRTSARGVQVYSLDARDYPQPAPAEARRRTVPLLGGGTRIIDPMPWDLAQLPFVSHSATFGSIVVQHLTERSAVLHARSSVAAPLRILAGANMPAVLVEVGFLTNAEDEALLGNPDAQAVLIEALVAAITDVRRGFAVGDGRHRP